MNQRIARLLCAVSVIIAVAAAAEPPRQAPLAGTPMERLLDVIAKEGRVSVIVRVRLTERFVPEPRLPAEKKKNQRAEMRRVKDQVIARNPRAAVQKNRDFASIPAFTVVITDAKALRDLAVDPGVEAITEDVYAEPILAESIPIVGADVAWASPYNVKGTNKAVVIIDSGVDKAHTFFKTNNVTRVIEAEEACFSSNEGLYVETCAGVSGGSDDSVTQFGSGAAAPCAVSNTENCSHGTRVTGVAAGAGSQFSGVAPEVKIIAINVASAFPCSGTCGSDTYSTRFRTSDVLAALDHVYSEILGRRTDVVAVNLSIAFHPSESAGYQASACDSLTAFTMNLANAIDNIHESGVAVVAGAGNASSTYGLPAPACIGNAIAVGATTDADQVPSYSNSAPNVDLLAPGGASATNGITTSVPGGGFLTDFGTSLAAPHVTGAFALLKQYAPAATVDDLLARFITNGVAVTDSRNNVTKPRLDIAETLQNFDTQPPTAPSNVMATAVSPTEVQIDWNASTDNVGVTSYVIERKALHAQAQWDEAGTVAGNASLLRFNDTGRLASSAYAYRVRAADASQNKAWSAVDYATTVLHEDDPIHEPWDPAGPTTVRGIHIGDLREAADAWREYAGLAASFTSYEAVTGFILDEHLTVVIAALNDARQVLGLPGFAYVNGVPTPADTVIVDDDHVQQVRDAMK